MTPEALKEERISHALKSLTGWTHESGHIKKTFKTQNYPETMGLVSAIGSICQKLNHHPDYMTVKFKEIEISFSTHSAGGITENDITAATEINKLFNFS